MNNNKKKRKRKKLQWIPSSSHPPEAESANWEGGGQKRALHCLVLFSFCQENVIRGKVILDKIVCIQMEKGVH